MRGSTNKGGEHSGVRGATWGCELWRYILGHKYGQLSDPFSGLSLKLVIYRK
jgi:hypothetical protein